MNITLINLNPFGFIQQMREPFQSSGSKQYQLRYKLTAYRSDISPEFHRTDNYPIHGTTVVCLYLQLWLNRYGLR